MATSGNSANYWTQAYGGIPNLPSYTTDTQSTTGTDKLGQLISGQPNFLANLGATTANISSNLQGQVGSDVTSNLAQQAAEWGQGSGVPLSQASATNFLAKYGLTSNALQQQGSKDYLSLMSQWPYTDQQTTSTTRDLSAEQAVYNASPVPSASAAASLASAQQGINAGKGSGGGSSPTSPVAATSGMGYGTGSNDLSWQNAWDSSPQITAATTAAQTEAERSRLWNAQNNNWSNTGATSDYAWLNTTDPWLQSQLGSSSVFDTSSLHNLGIGSGYGTLGNSTGMTSAGVAANQPTTSGSMYISPSDQQYSYYDPAWETDASYE